MKKLDFGNPTSANWSSAQRLNTAHLNTKKTETHKKFFLFVFLVFHCLSRVGEMMEGGRGERGKKTKKLQTKTKQITPPPSHGRIWPEFVFQCFGQDLCGRAPLCFSPDPARPNTQTPKPRPPNPERGFFFFCLPHPCCPCVLFFFSLNFDGFWTKMLFWMKSGF